MFLPIQPRVQTMAYGTFIFSGEEAETGRAEVFNGYIVCQHLSFRARDFSPHRNTRKHVRRS